MVVGLLAQAVAIVRHNTVVLTHALGAPAAVAADSLQGLAKDLLASICHPGSDGTNAAILPDGGTDRDGSKSSCPICNGLASAYGLAAPGGVVLERRSLASAMEFPAFDERTRTHLFIRPQSRGPPAAA